MYKTKAKSKIKNKLWKILTKEMVHKRMVQKLLSVGVSVSLMLAMVPLGSQNFVAEAADSVTIPDTMFITKADLVDLQESYPNGLLETGTDSDKQLFINFGTRPDVVQYYDDDSWSNSVSAAAGPMTWRVAGAENNGLVLYSKEPMISAKALDPSSDSRFQTSPAEITVSSLDPNFDYGTYSGDSDPTTLNSNHWGASNIRQQLNDLVATYFNPGEQGILEDSTVKTYDTKNSVDYATKDKLYAALSPNNASGSSATAIAVGEADNLKIDKAYWAGNYWLRFPYPGNVRALCTWAGRYVDYDNVGSYAPAGAVACRINLDSAIFASAASVVSTNDGVTPIPDSTPQRLRMSGDSRLSSAQISVDDNNFIYSAPAGSRLVVLATTFGGKTLQYSTNISQDIANATLTAQELQDITGFGGIIANAIAWIEMDDPDSNKSQLLYATDPVTFPLGFFDLEAVSPITLETVVNVNGIDQKILVRSTNAVIPDGTKLTAQADSNGEGLDHQNYIIEKKFHYEITLVDANGTPLPMPLSEPVELCFEVIEGWDKNDLEVVLRKIDDDDINFREKELKDIDGKQYICVQTNHFSPYSLLDKLNEEERNQVIFFAILGLSLIIGLPLGIMLKLRKNKKRSE